MRKQQDLNRAIPSSGTGAPMNVLLGPGIIDNIFDGIERPLRRLLKKKQVRLFQPWFFGFDALDMDKKLWNVDNEG